MLETLLTDPRRGADAVPFRELPGFLFAVLNAPEEVPSEEWIEEVFGGTDPTFESPDQRRGVMAELTALGDGVVAPVAANAGGLPPGVAFRQPPIANFADDAPLSAWARGFLRGYGWIAESWEGVDEEFGSVLGALGFFSSTRFASDAFETPADRLEELAATTLEVFADAALEYQQLGQSAVDSDAD